MAFYGRQIKIKCKSVTGFEATIECGAAALAQSESRKPIWMGMPHGGYGRGSRANGRMSDGYKAIKTLG
jgi:hypothetical protein